MRLPLISVLLLSLLAGCSGIPKIGPHRIDVQQGNALDQENIARLKPGLNRSQVRFLLGTPLLVDPFRTDRWDYVYVFYQAGKLAEQRRITLFFDGETLTRIEGDVPAAAPAPASTPAAPPAPASQPTSITPAAPVTVPTAGPASLAPQPQAAPMPQAVAASSIISPASGSKNAPASAEVHPPAGPGLQPETDVAQIKPDVIPPFPGSNPAAVASDDPVLKSLNAWVSAWAQHDDVAYLAAYDASFVPPGGGGRTDWEARRRLLLGVARNIDVKIGLPSVDRGADGSATVTFNQFYRSDNYRDAVVKQLRMIERDGRWLIVDEKVLSTLRGDKL